MLGIPRFTDYEHDFNTWVRRLAPPAAVVFFLLAVLMQQFLRSVVQTTVSSPPEHIRASEVVADPGIGAMVLYAKMAVKAKAGGYQRPWTDIQADIDARAGTRTDRLRAALIAGELVGKDAALERLTRLKGELDPGSPLRADVAAAETLYRKGRKALPDDDARMLIEHHGWFGRVAAAFGLPLGHPDRTEATAGIGRIDRALTAMNVYSSLSFSVGVLVLLAVLSRAGKKGFRGAVGDPGRAPGLYLEMFAVDTLLLVITVCTQTLTLWTTGVASIIALSFNEMLAWSTGLAAIWPVLRGMRWSEVAPDLGWTRGRGILAEVGWGVVAYLFMTPLARLVAILAQVLWDVLGFTDPSVPQGFPTFQPPLGGSWIPVILGALGAVILAPLAEETFYRGALFQFLRSKYGAAAAITLSGAIFGAIHPYAGPGVIQVAAMGVVFALIREWRGSLIAGVVAHALHNGTLQFFEIWTIQVINA